MNLKLNISTCPNDTFMFEALLHGRIDTEGVVFDLHLADIEQLNEMALAGEPDISKLSYAMFPQISGRFKILNSGSALGHGNGPLVVSRHKIYPDELCNARVAIPGKHTTANLLLDKLYPSNKKRYAYLFSDIAEVVMSGGCDAGVLIHEGRFVYRELGLQLVSDLGLEWEKRTKLPLPLGAIVISRRLDTSLQQKIDRVLRRSIEYARSNPAASTEFVQQYAQELSTDVTRSHIDLFVNDYSIDLGKEGRRAVIELLGRETPGLEDEEVFV